MNDRVKLSEEEHAAREIARARNAVLQLADRGEYTPRALVSRAVGLAEVSQKQILKAIAELGSERKVVLTERHTIAARKQLPKPRADRPLRERYQGGSTGKVSL